MTNETLKVYQSLARGLSDNGVDTLFGLMGDANLFMVDAFARMRGTRFVSATHEGSTVLMAHAYAQVTGRVGVATVTHGPALTNCVTALTDASRARVGMVLMAGDTPAALPYHLQNIDQKAVADLCGAGFEQVRAPETAARDLARALYRAQAEARPIVLNMPAEFMWEDAAHKACVHQPFDTPSVVPEGQMLDAAIGMIAAARRPLILAGRGAIDAGPALVRLADRLEAPLSTTLKAKGLFAGHPYCIDICGTLSTPAGYEALAQSDCIIAFGAGLNDWTTDRGTLFKGKRVIQVDTDAAAIGQTLHPDAALIADAGLMADNIVHWLDEAEIPSSGFTRDLEPGALAEHDTPKPRDRAEGTINYVAALEWLEETLPADRVLVTDGGRFMTEVWCRVSVGKPRDFVDTTNFGSIGLGLQAAIGAAAAEPERPVVLFSGDGGFMMGGLGEFHTAVRLGLDFIVILCNDAAYGAEHIQFVDRKMNPELSTFDWPCFAQVARSMGAEGVVVHSEEDLPRVEDALKSRKGPLLIDMHLDPEDVPRMRV